MTNNFIETKEYKKFKEFCDACLQYKYIGVCHGAAGVGKTQAARQYTNWDNVEPFLKDVSFREAIEPQDIKIDPIIKTTDSIFFTSPTVRPVTIHTKLSTLASNVKLLKVGFDAQEKKLSKEKRYEMLSDEIKKSDFSSIDLVIVDEIDRLKLQTLEILRDIYDQNDIGLILIGMPGIEKKLSRYPQLYSRIGFAHEFKKLTKTEMTHILEHRLDELGLSINYKKFDDYEAINKIVKLSNGNFRLLQRLFTQIDRVMEINHLKEITGEVVETARELLIIGIND